MLDVDSSFNSGTKYLKPEIGPPTPNHQQSKKKIPQVLSPSKDPGPFGKFHEYGDLL